MALIKCPECGSSISGRAESCPHCGLPAAYFSKPQTKEPLPGDEEIDCHDLGNMLLSFDRDHTVLFAADHCISHRDEEQFRKIYGRYEHALSNHLIFQYVRNHASTFRVDMGALNYFLNKMRTLGSDIAAHNTSYVDQTLDREKDYFDNILKDIDPDIKLDDEQRRAVATDDDYCLLVAGAGAGRTTTMAAKVKYLVEKKVPIPEKS